MEMGVASTRAMTPTQVRSVAAIRSMPCTQTARPASVSDQQELHETHSVTRMTREFDLKEGMKMGHIGHIGLFCCIVAV